MKKKRFYNNKKRNTKWTEEPQGRKISFADKYIDDGTNGTGTYKKKRFTKEKGEKLLKRVIIFVLCFAVVSVGYVIMDVHIQRRSMPEKSEEVVAGVAQIDIRIKATEVQPLSFDGGTMLEAVIKDVSEEGYTTVSFDLKREDGTIGYQSALATIDAYGAVASPATDLKGSIDVLVQNDIMPVGRISVYKDNIAPAADNANAIMLGNGVYRDEDGYSYLNPDSDGAYNYIKGIIEEAKGLGINVFVLDNCDLPDELGDGYSDGFDAISQRLYADFGDDIKLIKAVGVTISSADYKSISEEIEEINLADGEVLYVNAEYRERVKTILDNKDMNYIIG